MIGGRRRAAGWAPRDAAPALDATAHAPALRARAARGWQRLYADERDSVVAATLVATDLARLGAPPEILGLAARVIEDEVRHVGVCATVLRAFGATPSPPPAEATRASLGEGSSLETRLARALIVGFGVGEAMSAAGFAVARRTARAPLARWAYTELLRDEARHGAFGAEAGAWVVREWAPTRRRALWRDCVAEMEAMERRVGGPVSDALLAAEARVDGVDDLEALGILRGSRTCAAMTDAIPRWILPRLASLGVLPDPAVGPASSD